MKPKTVELKLSPEDAADQEVIRVRCAAKLKVEPSRLFVRPVRRSLDARRGAPKVVLRLEASVGSPLPQRPVLLERLPDRVRGRVLIIGAGPAGYFCALELLFLGLKPILFERGKDTRARRYDLRAVMQFDRVDPDSNYCFGEGGAGTYSDGKLYTRSGKRGEIDRVLQLLVEHGAKDDILVETHPHIGSNKLPQVVESLRETVLRCGGEVQFESKVTDLYLEDGQARGVWVGDRLEKGDAVVVATGHSARDVFGLLHRRGVLIEAKPYAVGVRVEHPQPLIDEIQYRTSPRGPHLPAASYRLAEDGVYSFCMCPGGLIVPAATAPGEIVVNGMSMSKRNSRWANSGIVTAVTDVDLRPFQDQHGVLAGVAFQQSLEQAAFRANGEGTQQAPAQRLTDLLADRVSQSLPRTSYVPGVVSVALSEVLTPRLLAALQNGFRKFAERMPAFLTEDAVVVGVESRTSSPVRIPREEPSLEHPQLPGLYPCGEGAGYAGGIVSAALDGQRVARAVAQKLTAGGELGSSSWKVGS